jgi:hypothetical protein
MLFDSLSPGMRDRRSGLSALLRSRIGLAVAGSLISASTFILLLCPCDRPAGSSYSIFLVSLSGLFGLAAAAIVYLRLRIDKGATQFISGFESVAIVAIAIYAEMRVAFYVIQWLALRGH